MRRWTILLALVLILVGVYSLLVQMGLPVPTWERIWPILPFAAGVTLWVSYLRERRSAGQVFWGTALVLAGLVLFLFTLDTPGMLPIETWWPIFVAIAGLSFLAVWLAQGLRDWDALFLALVGLGFGGAALALHLRPGLLPQLTRLWPVAIIAVGLLLLLRGTFGKRGGK